MRIQEERHPKESWLLFWLGNVTAIDSSWVLSFAFAWFFVDERGKFQWWPRGSNDISLYYNAAFFARYTVTPVSIVLWAALWIFDCWSSYWLLFGLFFSVRWSGSTTKKAIFQAGAGYKLNGRLGLPFRVQSDETSAEGVTGPNTGQATGWNYGTH